MIETPDFAPGTVWLVGAGPGDPGLLTLHALNALKAAEIVIYDALVSPAILDLIPPGIPCEYAGKRGGKPSPQQADISARLIDLAHAGKRIVRLKGGDPFVFGRGGEEAAALAAAGVRFRVIPGVTAGLAGLAYAGIPATTRDTNPALVLATGHLADDNPGGLDWRVLGASDVPIVLYMGLSTLPAIAEKLLAAGRPPGTPAAIVTNATLPTQQVLVAPLNRIAAEAKAAELKSPALIAIGSIVALRDTLAPWQITL